MYRKANYAYIYSCILLEGAMTLNLMTYKMIPENGTKYNKKENINSK